MNDQVVEQVEDVTVEELQETGAGSTMGCASTVGCISTPASVGCAASMGSK